MNKEKTNYISFLAAKPRVKTTTGRMLSENKTSALDVTQSLPSQQTRGAGQRDARATDGDQQGRGALLVRGDGSPGPDRLLAHLPARP